MLAGLAGATLIGSCNSDKVTANQAVSVARVALASPTDSVLVGDSLALDLTVEDANGIPIARPVTWTSSNAALATVSATGLVKAYDSGIVTITATVDGFTASTQVHLLERVSAAVIQMTLDRDTLRIRDTLFLNVQLHDAHGAVLQRRVTWQSSDDNVVTVGALDAAPPALARGPSAEGPLANTAVGGIRGFAVAKGPGTALITITAEGISDTLSLTVGEPIATMEVLPANGTVGVGYSLQMHVRLEDRNQQELQLRVQWTSSDPAVATVDSTGLVRGVSLGTCTITAASEDKSASATVAVVTPAVGLTVTPSTLVLFVGQTYHLAATVTDASGAVLDRVPVWSSADTTIATVNANILVTAVALGTTQITATIDGLTATTTVNVVAPTATLTISPASATIALGGSVDFTATLRDTSGNVVEDVDVTWTSSDATAVSVRSAGRKNGIAMGLAGGPSTITASAAGLTATASVTVGVPVVSVTMAPAGDSILIGDTLVVTATPRDAFGRAMTGQSITWVSDHPEFATVEGNGVVVGVAEGTASVRATAGGFTGATTVAVFRHPSSVTIDPPQAQVRMGDHITIKGTPRDEGGAATGGKVTYSSSDLTIATVSSSGIVTGVAEGTVTITASSGGKSASTTVVVTGRPPTTEEGLGNNLSVPVVFSEGIGLTGLPVTVDGAPNYPNTGLRPAATENLVVGGLPYFYAGNVSDCTWPDGTSAYCQDGLNAWQAEWLDGSLAGLQHASATWGDNIISQSLKTSAPIRIEVSLNDLTSGTLAGFNMQTVSGSHSTEVQGTNGTTSAMTPMIFTVVPHLVVSKLDTSGGVTVGDPVVDKRVIDGIGAEEGPGYFVAEVNGGGKVLYGYNLRVSEVGWYRVAFLLDGSVSNGTISATRNVIIDALTNSATEEEEGGSGGSGSGSAPTTGPKPVPQLAGDGSQTWIDIYVGPATGSGEGGGGGGDTGLGNNLSVPVTFAEGVGITGLPVSEDAGLRPLSTEGITVDARPFFWTGNTSDCSLGGVPFFCQQTANVWQADWWDASSQSARDAEVAWGDNVLTNHFNTHANVHVEILLTDLTTPAMQGFNMAVVSGSGATELDGTDGTTGTFAPMVYTRGARLKVELLDSTTHEPVFTVLDQGLWEGGDGPGQFATEVSMGGKLVYSYNLLVQQLVVPESVGHKYGWYRFTFSLDPSAPVGPNVRMTQLAAGGEEGTTEEGGGSGSIPSKNVPTLNVGAQSTSVEIWVAKGSGGTGAH
ncbi:MAG TPA: Ig-like domain-containing protein [Gemmatimonadaceae bacterium]|nr:Ig-like domain-containing protein [Gemmatimonadaceae bacterium]